jgi:hypothetical protein
MAASYDKTLVQAHDFLGEPLSPARIASRTEALNAALTRNENLNLGLMITALTGGLLYLGELILFHQTHYPKGLLAALSYIPLAMVASSFLAAFFPTYWHQRLADMSFIEEEDELKMQWLIERVPGAQQLAGALIAEPRRYLRGEFNAVNSAYEAAKPANL